MLVVPAKLERIISTLPAVELDLAAPITKCPSGGIIVPVGKDNVPPVIPVFDANL